ncbi:MAG: xanthine dehydrogenase family protein subunit M [Gemmatimonadetes bacterium]|nr:xanthine dehydrogenase family protein subunit M [Gemmatimonadota bacterium]MDA1103668.1 xanthine dehydrogenase family protein subunit M [Gemmatimonadota bacterium]
MAKIRDMIPAFELLQPTTIEAAIDLLDEHRSGAWVLAGGLDSFDWFKDRIKRPSAVIDLGGIPELTGIRDAEGGLEIGAMTTLTSIVRHPRIRSEYSIVADAAEHVATPQIRNQGTMGGNLAQDTRCWYYRSGWPCYRAGGNTCYASAPQAMNREHCIMGRSRCVAVNPSDTAPALIAVDAKMIVENTSGPKVYDAEDFFIGPSIDITRMTVMKPRDLLTRVHIPAAWANAEFYYEKVRDRGSWDFQLVSIAAAFRMSGGTIEEARIAVNGVAPYPVRLDAVERLVAGTSGDEATANRAGDLAIAGARALRHNDYKIPMMRNLVRRAVGSVA